MATYLIPIKTVTGLNAREHWRARASRVKKERQAAALIVKPFPIPCVVRMTRLSSRLCDDDNLQGACKAIRDQIAEILGSHDGPRSPIKWEYAQEQCKRGEFGVRIEFEPLKVRDTEAG